MSGTLAGHAAPDPRRYFDHVASRARPHRRGRAGLPLSRDDQPLQSALHDLSAHFRGARAAGGHELGAVHQHRRPVSAHRPRRAAWRRRADDGARPAAHDPLSEGPRHLRAVQHQRHAADRAQGAGTDRRGLDELRVSLDAAEPQAFELVRGRDMFARIVRNIRAFRAMQRELGAATPRVSLWLTGLKETIGAALRFRPAGARHRHVARSICSAWSISPKARAWRGRNRRCSRTMTARRAGASREAEALARELGISFNASGATDPATSLKQHA